MDNTVESAQLSTNLVSFCGNVVSGSDRASAFSDVARAGPLIDTIGKFA